MNQDQLTKAQKVWGFSMDISLAESSKYSRMYVACSGYITEDPEDVKQGKHSGCLNGFYYQAKRVCYIQDLRNVIESITGEQQESVFPSEIRKPEIRKPDYPFEENAGVC